MWWQSLYFDDLLYIRWVHIQFTLLFRFHFIFKPSAKEDFRERIFFRGFFLKEYSYKAVLLCNSPSFAEKPLKIKEYSFEEKIVKKHSFVVKIAKQHTFAFFLKSAKEHYLPLKETAKEDFSERKNREKTGWTIHRIWFIHRLLLQSNLVNADTK